MKRIHYILLICGVALASCHKTIDLYPLSNINTGTYYSNYDEVRTALNGVYNGMQRPLANEWQFTELRSDN
ncbi:MAG TPA: RagB/SusD family nutrient uptake outer membrane protein, partial [Chitinophagaceae bacterium]|nr:RagB/SusD family nutrient uptake outer membrane protein [Chitinophagaceae bacterium]